MLNIRFLGTLATAFTLVAMSSAMAADKMNTGHMGPDRGHALVSTSMNSLF